MSALTASNISVRNLYYGHSTSPSALSISGSDVTQFSPSRPPQVHKILTGGLYKLTDMKIVGVGNVNDYSLT